MKGNCEICDKEIEILMCCSGRECGCMGLPSEPPVCSDGCENKYKEVLELREKCKNSTDYFFIYGWQKRIEELTN